MRKRVDLIFNKLIIPIGIKLIFFIIFAAFSSILIGTVGFVLFLIALSFLFLFLFLYREPPFFDGTHFLDQGIILAPCGGTFYKSEEISSEEECLYFESTIFDYCSKFSPVAGILKKINTGKEEKVQFIILDSFSQKEISITVKPNNLGQYNKVSINTEVGKHLKIGSKLCTIPYGSRIYLRIPKIKLKILPKTLVTPFSFIGELNEKK